MRKIVTVTLAFTLAPGLALAGQHHGQHGQHHHSRPATVTTETPETGYVDPGPTGGTAVLRGVDRVTAVSTSGNGGGDITAVPASTNDGVRPPGQP